MTSFGSEKGEKLSCCMGCFEFNCCGSQAFDDEGNTEDALQVCVGDKEEIFMCSQTQKHPHNPNHDANLTSSQESFCLSNPFCVHGATRDRR